MSDSPPPSFALKIPKEPKRKYLTAVLQPAPIIPPVQPTEAPRLKNQQLPAAHDCSATEERKKKLLLNWRNS